MSIEDLDMPSPEEIKQFYAILEKMNKMEQKIQNIQKENNIETDTEPLSSFIRLKLDIDIIEDGKSLTQSENILSAIKRNYEIPIPDHSDPENIANNILDSTTLFLENFLREKYNV